MLISLILLLCDFDCCVMFLSSLVNILRNFGSPLTSTGSLAVPPHATLLPFVVFLWTCRGRRPPLVVRPVAQDDARADARPPRHLLRVEDEIFETSSNWTISRGGGERPALPPTVAIAIAVAVAVPGSGGPSAEVRAVPVFHRWAYERWRVALDPKRTITGRAASPASRGHRSSRRSSQCAA